MHPAANLFSVKQSGHFGMAAHYTGFLSAPRAVAYMEINTRRQDKTPRHGKCINAGFLN